MLQTTSYSKMVLKASFNFFMAVRLPFLMRNRCEIESMTIYLKCKMQKYSTSIAFLGIRIGIPTSYITERALEFRLVRIEQKLVCTERCIFRCKRLRETRSVEQRQPGGGIHSALPNRQTLPLAFTRRSNETKTNRGYRTC